jgi:hypothetical protein
MAAFTSTGSGNWNDGATWGNASPGSKGTDWPGNAGDTFNVAAGHTVTYNVSETNALGASQVNGILSFLASASTKMILSAALTVQNGGTLRMGSSGTPIDSSHTAELYFTVGDGSNGLVLAATGKLEAYGTDFTGSKHINYLTANWTSGQTFTVKGDVTAAWAAGQTLVVQRFHSAYPTAIGGGEYTIASMAANGSDTDVTISEAAPGTTFRAGAIVMHTKRNVALGKTSATRTLGNKNTSRPVFSTNSTSVTVAYVDVQDAEFVGVQQLFIPGAGNNPYMKFTRVVARNGYFIGSAGAGAQTMNTIWNKCLFISWVTFYGQRRATFTECVMFDTPISQMRENRFTDCYFVQYNGLMFDFAIVQNIFINCDWVELQRAIGCVDYTGPVMGNKFFNCNFGMFRHHSNTCTFTQHYNAVPVYGGDHHYNSKFNVDVTYYDWSPWPGPFVRYDDYGGTLGDTRTHSRGVRTKTNATIVRDGGSAIALEVSDLTYNDPRYLNYPLFEWVEWDVPASEQTRKIYIRGGNGGSEDWSTYPTAAELFLEAEYYDEAGTCHKAFVVSNDVLTDNTTWTAFDVSFTPGRVGQVVYRLRLGLVTGVASKKLYVDPQLNS